MILLTIENQNVTVIEVMRLRELIGLQIYEIGSVRRET